MPALPRQAHQQIRGPGQVGIDRPGVRRRLSGRRIARGCVRGGRRRGSAGTGPLRRPARPTTRRTSPGRCCRSSRYWLISRALSRGTADPLSRLLIRSRRPPVPDSYALYHHDNTFALRFAKECIANPVSQRDNRSPRGGATAAERDTRPGTQMPGRCWQWPGAAVPWSSAIPGESAGCRRFRPAPYRRVDLRAGGRPRDRTAAGSSTRPRATAGSPRTGPIRRVHGDSSMFVGGIRALLLQSLHPLAMAGVAAHSGYRGDPWGRLQRTSYFLAVTTFGRASDAQAATERVRAIHRRVTGTAPDGRPYARLGSAPADLGAHRRGGQLPARAHPVRGRAAGPGRAATGTSPTWPGSPSSSGCPTRPAPRPSSRTGSASTGRSCAAPPRPARRPASCCCTPPLPLVARGPYGVLAAAATSLLPGWARRPLYLPHLPLTERARGPPGRPRGHPGDPLGDHPAAPCRPARRP